MPLRPLALVLLAAVAAAGPARAELRGHGGPVRALAVLPGGDRALSGSFDGAAIVWNIEEEKALAIMRFHDGAVNAVASLPDGRFASGGEDGRIALWRPGEAEPARVIVAHHGPIAGLAVSPDGKSLGSASWDGTARVTAVESGQARVLEGHAGNVNAIAFAPDGAVVTAAYDGTLRSWPPDGGPPAVLTLPSALSVVAVAPEGERIAGGADGVLRMVGADGAVRAALDLQAGPITALALSPDGARMAAATASGSVALVERTKAKIALRLAPGPRGPVWALVFRPATRELLAGGNDGIIRRYDAVTGEPIGAASLAAPGSHAAVQPSEPGARVFQACAACHALTPEGGNRAGPTLYGVFGRRIATVPGYRYSDALRKLDIVWNAETIAKLFEVGPARFTPGTKMPEQHVSAADRAALVAFLEKATRPTP